MTIQLCKTCIQKGSRWPRIDLKQTQRDSYIPSLFLKIYSDRCFIEFFTAGMFIHVFINAKFKFCSLTINFLKKTTTSFYIVILKQTNKKKNFHVRKMRYNNTNLYFIPLTLLCLIHLLTSWKELSACSNFSLWHIILSYVSHQEPKVTRKKENWHCNLAPYK